MPCLSQLTLSDSGFLQCVTAQLIYSGLTWNLEMMILVSMLIYFSTGQRIAVLAGRNWPNCVTCFSTTAFILHQCSWWKLCQRLQWYKRSPSLRKEMVLYYLSFVFWTQNSAVEKKPVLIPRNLWFSSFHLHICLYPVFYLQLSTCPTNMFSMRKC